MASQSLLRSLLLLFPLSVQALQVTPNSPCAPVCQDSDALDTSDPLSSNTKNSDITCDDTGYGSSNTGIKWMNCMSCLQNSTFSQGSESDQAWFLYNSRYLLSYCVFGFPNATGVAASPCITSTACGPLENAFESGIIVPSTSPQYAYCSEDGDAMTSESYGNCLACISAGDNSQYLSNHLVALEAGCLQKPAPGKLLGLNGTVFSDSMIGIVDPATLDKPVKTHSSLTTATVAGIVAGALVFLAIAAATIFIYRRKKTNRLARAAAGEAFRNSPGPQSPLSFQCQTRMDPKSPKFFSDYPVDETPTLYAHPGIQTRGSPWKDHKAVPTFQDFSAISSTGTGITSSGRKRQDSHHPLHTLDTAILPSPPSATHHSAHASPSSAILRGSPSDPYATPTSTTSTRSTTQLLPKYTPTQSQGPYSPATDRASPLGAGVGEKGRGWSSPSLAQAAWTSVPPPKSPRMVVGGGGKRGGESGSPVESRRIEVKFPPPPPPRPLGRR